MTKTITLRYNDDIFEELARVKIAVEKTNGKKVSWENLVLMVVREWKEN